MLQIVPSIADLAWIPGRPIACDIRPPSESGFVVRYARLKMRIQRATSSYPGPSQRRISNGAAAATNPSTANDANVRYSVPRR